MDADFAVIGAGIAGASAAYELAAGARVVLIERESQPGYHTTGRSAALYTENYGEPTMRALTRASRRHLEHPPADFAEHPLLSPRGALFIARSDQRARLEAALERARALDDPPPVVPIDGAEARAKVPVLRPDYVAAALFEADARDIDVHGLHHGYLRGLRARGGALLTDAEVSGLTRNGERWRITTRAAEIDAEVVVDAAGAWADEIAALAGAPKVGLVPKRRTAFTFDAPIAVDDWPMTIDIDETFYMKPEAGRLLASPADETPMPPCDVQPDELDIAIAVDRIERATTLSIRRLTHRWAGLRSFVADHLPVIGYDPACPGFFWLAGQGGVGIMTAPAVARLAAALALGEQVPEDLTRRGIEAAAFSPARLPRTG